ncbi:MAG: hypothetical protein QXJ53_03635 [Candidatus Bathyarchaeia archaeon]
MDETKAEAEAWVRTKPKRIIHNQTLIQLLFILAMATPIPASGLVMYLAFCVAPAIVIPSILVLWFAAVIFEICVWVLRRRRS